MARSMATDFLSNMRFQVDVGQTSGGGTLPLGAGDAQGGFSSCSTPEETVELVDYKEGQYLFSHKFPGNTTWNNVTLMRGVIKQNTPMYDWVSIVVYGGGEYRTEVTIKHFHRSDTLPSGISGGALTDAQKGGTGIPETLNFASASKKYHLFQALPVRHKFSSDLAGSDSAVSVAELEIGYEYATIENTP